MASSQPFSGVIYDKVNTFGLKLNSLSFCRDISLRSSGGDDIPLYVHPLYRGVLAPAGVFVAVSGRIHLDPQPTPPQHQAPRSAENLPDLPFGSTDLRLTRSQSVRTGDSGLKLLRFGTEANRSQKASENISDLHEEMLGAQVKFEMDKPRCSPAQSLVPTLLVQGRLNNPIITKQMSKFICKMPIAIADIEQNDFTLAATLNAAYALVPYAVTHALRAPEITQGSRRLRPSSPTARVLHICNRSCWHIKIAASGLCPVNPGAAEPLLPYLVSAEQTQLSGFLPSAPGAPWGRSIVAGRF
ncbi:hypothetical protein ROHU_014637 [Labeo rohita]|uniref:Uncharacterized protein n=1 Tax=Labeo rohita TaxID=84645 RepID=A0A498NTB9_LABRO|nr:hypothetical protein ROHU_014637 [Labeo rohita]